MTTIEWVLERKIIAIVRGVAPNSTLRMADALYEGGIDLMEVAFNQARPETWADTAAAIKAVGEHMLGRMLVGAGTVLTQEQLSLTAEAGARYMIAPNVNPALIRKGKARGLAVFAGALTPSEVVLAFEAGADAVKVFPAGELGPSYIRALKAPLPHIPLIAVGGVNERNAADFFQAGCCAIGVGGNLVNKQWVEDGQWDSITALARQYRKAAETK